MAARAVTEAVSLRLPAAIMDDLQAHLFRDDGDEHGAVIGASVLRTERGLRLIGRRLFLAQDGVDYVPGIRGYRRLTPEFVRRCVRECAEERLAYLAVHNHFGTSRVAFSADDLASHRRGYPALIDILDGPPAGALVFAQDAVAGDVWLTHEEQAALDCATVLAPTPRRLYPEPQRPPGADARYDRQVRLFGDRGQHILAMQRVGIVGLGGGSDRSSTSTSHASALAISSPLTTTASTKRTTRGSSDLDQGISGPRGFLVCSRAGSDDHPPPRSSSPNDLLWM